MLSFVLPPPTPLPCLGLGNCILVPHLFSLVSPLSDSPFITYRVLPTVGAVAAVSWQAHFDRCALPISDYVTDTRSVLDQAVRVINAMLDIAAGFGLLETTLGLLRLHQMLVQVRRRCDSYVITLSPLPDANHRQGVHDICTSMAFPVEISMSCCNFGV